jgi:hypothetical protein
MKIAELTFDADILVLAPWRAGRNLACRSAGFLYPSRSAASRVKRNWGSAGFPSRVARGKRSKGGDVRDGKRVNTSDHDDELILGHRIVLVNDCFIPRGCGFEQSSRRSTYVWVLIDSTRNQTRNIILFPEDLRERV